MYINQQSRWSPAQPLHHVRTSAGQAALGRRLSILEGPCPMTAREWAHSRWTLHDYGEGHTCFATLLSLQDGAILLKSIVSNFTSPLSRSIVLTFVIRQVCQMKVWGKHHKAECATVAQIQEREAVFRLSLRLVLNHQAANIKLRKEWPLISALQAKSAQFAHHGDMQNLTAFHCFVDDEKQIQDIYCRVYFSQPHNISLVRPG